MSPGRRKTRAALLAGTVLLTTAPASAQDSQRLNATEIRAQIIGRDITDDYHWTEYYRRDGAMLVEDLGNRRTGRWTIEHDTLCTANDRAARLRCWQVWLSGSEVSLRERPQDQTPPAFLRRHEGR